MPEMNLTRLQGVNRILRGAREHPVSSLGNETQNDSLLAEQTLDEIILREQMTGLHVNTTEVSFDIDANDQIVLPSNTLQVKAWNQHIGRNFFHKKVNGTVLLYDGDEAPATSDFSATGANLATVYLKITQSLDFDDLPLAHQFSMVDQAALEYQTSVLGDPRLEASLEKRAARSRALARAYDIRSMPNNQFEDGVSPGPVVGRAVPRAWGQNRNVRRQD